MLRDVEGLSRTLSGELDGELSRMSAKLTRMQKVGGLCPKPFIARSVTVIVVVRSGMRDVLGFVSDRILELIPAFD